MVVPVKLRMENLIGFLLGWPSLAIALCLAVIGTWLARPLMFWIALVLSAPVALYVSATLLLPFVGIIPMGALVIAARTCRNESRRLTFVSVGIYMACVAALAYLVITD